MRTATQKMKVGGEEVVMIYSDQDLVVLLCFCLVWSPFIFEGYGM
jgi:hypothetical protein